SRDLRDLGAMGGLRDAGARPAAAHRDRRRALVPAEGGEPARAFRAATRATARGPPPGARAPARTRAVLTARGIQPDRRLGVDAGAGGRRLAGAGTRDGLQPERRRRDGLGRAGGGQGGGDLPAARARRAGGADAEVPRVVQRAAPPPAVRPRRALRSASYFVLGALPGRGTKLM